MASRRRGEERFYEPVRQWLTSHRGYYTGGEGFYLSGKKKNRPRYYTKTGVRELQADVVGVKFAGNNLVSGVEVCVVEVKNSAKITRQDINQAYGYKSLAHVVYLAAPSAIGASTRDILQTVGLGYLQLYSKGLIKEIQTPTPTIPTERELIRLLKSLWIGRCSLCQCYFPLWEEWNGEGKTYFRLRRPKVPSDVARNPSLGYELNQGNEITRYLCYYCQNQFTLKAKPRQSLDSAD